jgi:hypothetical protein
MNDGDEAILVFEQHGADREELHEAFYQLLLNLSHP